MSIPWGLIRPNPDPEAQRRYEEGYFAWRTRHIRLTKLIAALSFLAISLFAFMALAK